ncbi:MAG: RraA family protein [Candidatus Handelsmanbacteria bacterium]|nr:RraA family protein [Candidatus Handelsmanbacteria bacterium]
MHEEWKPVYTALVCDIMDQLGHRDQAMIPQVRPTRHDTWFAGPALTLDAHATSENLPDPYGQIFAAYDQMKGGEVVVLATNGELRSGIWGELLSTAAAARGVKSVVTDGLVRDIRQMDQMGFGCCCRGFSPLDSAGRCVARAVNVPVNCGGVLVHPGDFVLVDFDGVAVIPAAIRDEVFRKSMEKLEGENTVRDELAAGHSPRAVFDKYGIL